MILSREHYRQVWDDRQVLYAYIAVDEGVLAGDVGGVIRAQLGGRYRLNVRSSAEQIAYFAAQAREAFSVQYLMEVVLLLLVVVAIGDALAAGVMERTRELGMMRAVGLGRSSLFRAIMSEGMIVATVGLLLALAAGLALGVFWVQMQFTAIMPWGLDLYFPMGFVAIAASLTILMCILGSILPAMHASRISVAHALRQE